MNNNSRYPVGPRLVLRADGNAVIGLGHVIRLLALTELVGPIYTECIFLIQAPTDSILILLHRAGITVAKLPAGPLTAEATQTVPPLLRPTDVLVLDGYGFDYTYQTALQPWVARLVCLDDMHIFPFAADLVLNPAGGVSPAVYTLHKPNARLLTGPAYAPLRREFQPADKHLRSSDQLPLENFNPQRATLQLLLCLGGADPNYLTRSTATELLTLQGLAHVHVVVGAAYANWEALHAWAADYADRLTLYQALSAAELADLMRRCEVAVLTPSTISYEYCSVGGGLLLLLLTANNQRDLDYFLRKAGLGLPYAVAPNVLTLAEAPRLVNQLRQAQQQYFDGQQGQRLYQEFAALLAPLPPLRLRPVHATDSNQLLVWTNDPTARQQSFDTALVSLPHHEAWLTKQLMQPERYLLLLAEETATGQQAGLIRFEFSSDKQHITLSYSLDPAFRGRGWAAGLLLVGTRAALAYWPAATRVVAEVKTNNVASVRALQRAGYREVLGSGPTGSCTFVWVAAPQLAPAIRPADMQSPSCML